MVAGRPRSLDIGNPIGLLSISMEEELADSKHEMGGPP